jgi:hypothetical protein
MIATNPVTTVLKILDAYTPGAVDGDSCAGKECFDVSIQSGDTDIFLLLPGSGGWILLFQGARDTGNSESGYDRNSWEVIIEVSDSRDGVTPRLIQLTVQAPLNVLGCTDATAWNYVVPGYGVAAANTDDDTCEYCFQVPNSENRDCNAAGAVGITSVSCSPFYLETGAAGVNLGCTLTCEAAEQEWLADCTCTALSADCVAKKDAWTNAGCEPQTCG